MPRERRPSGVEEEKGGERAPEEKKKTRKKKKRKTRQAERPSFANSEADSHVSDVPSHTSFSHAPSSTALVTNEEDEKSRQFKMRNMFRTGATDTGVPDHWHSSSDEEVGDEETPFFKAATEEDGGDRGGDELTRFILEEQQEEQMDPQQAKFNQDMRDTDQFMARLKDGISVKRVLTKYLTPRGKSFIRSSNQTMAEKKNLISGKTFMVEVERVLYMQFHGKTINWRGPKIEAEGYASPFMLTRTKVQNYQVAHMLKPLTHERKRFIRLVFKCPKTASIQYERMEIDIFARDQVEFDDLKSNFTLLWRYHAYRLKLLENDPKMLLRKLTTRPKTREERWEQNGYKPLLLQQLDPDDVVQNVYIAGGLSLEDATLIAASMLCFYGLLFFAMSLMVKAHLDAHSGFVQWSFFYVLLLVGGFLIFGRTLSKLDLSALGLVGQVTVKNSRHTVTHVPHHASGKSVQEVVKELLMVPSKMFYLFFIELFLFGSISLIVMLGLAIRRKYRAFEARGGFKRLFVDMKTGLFDCGRIFKDFYISSKDDCVDYMPILKRKITSCPAACLAQIKYFCSQLCKALMGKAA